MTQEMPEFELWAVEAVDGEVTVLVLADETEDVVVSEVATDLLGDRAVVGTLLQVPLGDVGEPVWGEATPAPEEGQSGGG